METRNPTSLLVMGRIYLIGEETERVFYCHELEPMEGTKGSSAEWVKMYFDELDSEAIRELFDLPKEGDLQILFSGRVKGRYNYFDEYDEDFETESVEFKAVPKEYADFYLGVDQPTVPEQLGQ